MSPNTGGALPYLKDTIQLKGKRRAETAV